MILVFLASLIAQIKETNVTVECPPFRRMSKPFPLSKLNLEEEVTQNTTLP